MPIQLIDNLSANDIYDILKEKTLAIRANVIRNLTDVHKESEVLGKFEHQDRDHIEDAIDQIDQRWARLNTTQKVDYQRTIDRLGQRLHGEWQRETEKKYTKAYEEQRKPYMEPLHKTLKEKEKKDAEIERLTETVTATGLGSALDRKRSQIQTEIDKLEKRASDLIAEGRYKEADELAREKKMYTDHLHEFDYDFADIQNPDNSNHGAQAKLFIRAQQEALKKAAEESETLRRQVRTYEEQQKEEEAYKENVKEGSALTLSGKVLGGKGASRARKMFAGEGKDAFSKWGSSVMGKLPAISKAVMGFVAALFLGGSWSWVLAFLTWAMVDLLPKDVEPPKNINLIVENEKALSTMWRKYGFSNAHSTSSLLRSLFKILSIYLFYSAISGSGIPFANLLLVALAFIGYSSLKIEYDDDKPGELIESALRFGLLGVFIIPFVIYGNIFGNFTLGLIAFAFYAVPPIPKVKEGDVTKSSTEGIFGFHRMLFLIVMVIIGINLFGGDVFGLGSGWGTDFADNPLGSLLLYFYIMAAITGLFAPPKDLPQVGGLFLGVATLIFAMGAGTQVVGTALIGQWFPTVYVGVSDALKPLTDTLYSFQNTISSGFQLITNPVGYATAIINGTYAHDPDTGVAGALGVEIENFRTTQIFSNQPYVISYNLNNKGSAEATNVKAGITLGGKTFLSGKGIGDTYLVPTDLGLKGDQTAGQPASGLELLVNQPVLKETKSVYTITTPLQMDKSAIEQVQFQSNDNGITCKSVIAKDLKEKFLPLMAVAQYDYTVESQLEMDFISQAEWNRLVKEGRLPALAKKPAQITNSPIRLNIDTLDQPIKAGTDFHLAFNFQNAQPDGKIVRINSIEIDYPAEFGSANCNPGKLKSTDTTHTIKVETQFGAAGVVVGVDNILKTFGNVVPASIICRFTQGANKVGLVDVVNEPKRTFFVRAKATFIYQTTDTRDSKLEFGGYRCCYPALAPAILGTKTGESRFSARYACLTGETCDAETYVCGGAGQPPASGPGTAGFCSQVKKDSGGQAGCTLGAGGCNNVEDCVQTVSYATTTQPNPTDPGNKLACRDVSLSVNVCCPANALPDQCKAVYNEWIKNPGATDATIQQQLTVALLTPAS